MTEPSSELEAALQQVQAQTSEIAALKRERDERLQDVSRRGQEHQRQLADLQKRSRIEVEALKKELDELKLQRADGRSRVVDLQSHQAREELNRVRTVAKELKSDNEMYKGLLKKFI